MTTAYNLPASPDAPQIDLEALNRAMATAASNTTQINIDAATRYAGTAGDLATSISNTINPQIAREFYSYLDNVNPNWRDNLIGSQDRALTQVSNYANELMTGVIPKDVVDNTMSSVMELGYKRGQFGGLAGSNVARNLGLTSLQLKDKGAELFTNGVSKLSNSLLQSTQALIPKTLDYNQLMGNIMGGLSSTLTNANGAQNAIAGAFQTNADLLWSSRLTAFNSEIDRRVNEQNMNMWQESINAQARQAQLAAQAQARGASQGATAASNPSTPFTAPSATPRTVYGQINPVYGGSFTGSTGAYGGFTPNGWNNMAGTSTNRIGGWST